MTTVIGTPLGVTASQRSDTPIPRPPVTTGLAFHLDAADASTFTYSSGVNVATWADKSGNGVRLTTSVGAPLRNFTLNGRTAVDFNLNSAMTGGDRLDLGINSLTVVSVHKAPPGNSAGIIGRWRVGATAGMWLHFHEGNRSAGYSDGSFRTATKTFTDTTSAHVHSSMLDRSAGSNNLAVDGVIGTPVTFPPDAAISRRTDQDLHVGALRNAGNDGYYAGFYAGVIAEIIVYHRALPTIERQQVESYLKDKWNTP